MADSTFPPFDPAPIHSVFVITKFSKWCEPLLPYEIWKELRSGCEPLTSYQISTGSKVVPPPPNPVCASLCPPPPLSKPISRPSPQQLSELFAPVTSPAKLPKVQKISCCSGARALQAQTLFGSESDVVWKK